MVEFNVFLMSELFLWTAHHRAAQRGVKADTVEVRINEFLMQLFHYFDCLGYPRLCVSVGVELNLRCAFFGCTSRCSKKCASKALLQRKKGEHGAAATSAEISGKQGCCSVDCICKSRSQEKNYPSTFLSPVKKKKKVSQSGNAFL